MRSLALTAGGVGCQTLELRLLTSASRRLERLEDGERHPQRHRS